jgi:hypothetical protein
LVENKKRVENSQENSSSWWTRSKKYFSNWFWPTPAVSRENSQKIPEEKSNSRETDRELREISLEFSQLVQKLSRLENRLNEYEKKKKFGGKKSNKAARWLGKILVFFLGVGWMFFQSYLFPKGLSTTFIEAVQY